MKKIKILVFALLVGSTFILPNCTSETELEGADITTRPTIVGWAACAITEIYYSDIGTLENTHNVNVLNPRGNGAPISADVMVTLSVDNSSSAIEGNQFSLPSTTFTIPAGKTFARVPISVNTGAFSPSSTITVTINIQSSMNGVVISSLGNKISITFMRCQSDLTSSAYNVSITRRNTGSVATKTNISLTTLGVNSFENPFVGHWPLEPNVRFKTICGKLYIQSHDLANTKSNQVTAATGPNNFAGDVDENGNFTLSYDITSTFGIYDAVYTKEYI